MKTLPKGLRLDRGYLQIRLFNDGVMHCENFGKDSAESREIAIARLAELRKLLLMWQHKLIEKHPFKEEPILASKKFSEAANLYFDLWAKETNPDGTSKHTPAAQTTCRGILDRSLIAYFGKYEFDAIRPIDIQTWRDRRVKTILGTSANREQNVLSSIFSHIEQWVLLEKIKPFKIPVKNPCAPVDRASTRKRERVLTSQELSILKQACIQANDLDLWEICKMGLKSLLRKKDLMRLETGESIDINQAKTGKRINLPIQVLKPLNYINFRKRWEAIRKAACIPDCQFRDLRKTGANLLKMKGYSTKLMSEFLGHTNTDTTEVYMVKNAAHLKPLAQDLADIVDSL